MLSKFTASFSGEMISRIVPRLQIVDDFEFGQYSSVIDNCRFSYDVLSIAIDITRILCFIKASDRIRCLLALCVIFTRSLGYRGYDLQNLTPIVG
jgi:hypothetical protein